MTHNFELSSTILSIWTDMMILSSGLIYVLLILALFFQSAVTTGAVSSNETDRLAMLEFKSKTTDSSFGVMRSWNSSIFFCSCSGITRARHHQQVTALDLSSHKLAGSISLYTGLQVTTILEDIVIGIAFALDYLHNQHCQTPVLHCDLKRSNVLLDERMTAQVGDFGLVKFFLQGTDNLPTTSSAGIRGTIGYAAPGYRHGITPKKMAVALRELRSHCFSYLVLEFLVQKSEHTVREGMICDALGKLSIIRTMNNK